MTDEIEPMALMLERAQRNLTRLINGQVTGGSANLAAGLVIEAMQDYQASLKDPSDEGPAPMGWRCTSCLRGLGGHEISIGSLCTECLLTLR